MQIIKKKLARRKRRRQHIRKKLKGSATRPRLTVYRSAKHIYCQAVDDFTGVTLASASTMSRDVKEELTANSGNVQGATTIGKMLAARLKESASSVSIATDTNIMGGSRRLPRLSARKASRSRHVRRREENRRSGDPGQERCGNSPTRCGSRCRTCCRTCCRTGCKTRC